jgi:hypothetical protein
MTIDEGENHMHLRFWCIVAGVAVATLGVPSHGALADQAPERPRQHTGEATFKAVSELSYDAGGPALRGARRADPKEFTASFYTSYDDGACTSTHVGPQALLTAAHCVADGGVVRLERRGTTWKGVCTHAEEYGKGDDSADWALCALDAPVPSAQYERVNTDASRLQKDAEIQLTGFGCTNPDGSGGNDGIYRIGEVKITALPEAGGNDILTDANTVICPGDSGGPAFRYLTPDKRKRVQVSVNSRVSVVGPGAMGTRSYLSSVSTPEAKGFFTKWRTATGLAICGIDDGLSGCHQ